MKLWILKPVYDLPKGDDPWNPWYDKVFCFLIYAETEADARKFAHEEAGDENRGEFKRVKIANTKSPWLEAKYSTCNEFRPDHPGVVMRDYYAAA